MRTRILFYTLLIYICVTLQVIVFNELEFFGVKANIIIILIVCISLLEGSIHGASIGFFAGLCLDSVIGISLGYYALIGMFLGLILGNINKRFFKENILVMAISTFLSTILFESVVILSSYIFGFKMDYFSSFTKYILPEAAINSILGIVLFIIIIQLNRRVNGVVGKKRY